MYYSDEILIKYILHVSWHLFLSTFIFGFYSTIQIQTESL